MLSVVDDTKQRYIYVLLSSTHTLPATLIRLWTREPYSHTSIALDVELKEMYSFARKNVYNPFYSTFIDEDIEKGIFGMDKSIKCCVYAVPVTEEQYQKIRNEINRFVKYRDQFQYNYIGLIGVMFGKNIEDEKHFFCSQFVSYVFNKSGIRLFKKRTGLIRPYDFHIRLQDKIIYKGKLCDYRNFLKVNQISDIKYVDKWYA